MLDLERLARHRGSLLGDLPGDAAAVAESVRKRDLLAALGAARSRAARSTSNRRAGGSARCSCPTRCSQRMRDGATASRCDTPLPLRVALLKSEYAHFLAEPDAAARRACARWLPLHGKAAIARWADAAASGDLDALIGELLEAHYDPMYGRSIGPAISRAATSALPCSACAIASAAGFRRAGARRARRTRRRHDGGCWSNDERLRDSGSSTCSPEDALRRQSARGVRGRARSRRRRRCRRWRCSSTCPRRRSSCRRRVATARVRIFTPTFEMPFAGHPTLGTAHVVRDACAAGDARDAGNAAPASFRSRASGDRWTLEANAPRTARRSRRRAMSWPRCWGSSAADLGTHAAVGRHRQRAAGDPAGRADAVVRCAPDPACCCAMQASICPAAGGARSVRAMAYVCRAPGGRSRAGALLLFQARRRHRGSGHRFRLRQPGRLAGRHRRARCRSADASTRAKPSDGPAASASTSTPTGASSSPAASSSSAAAR